MTQTEEQPEYTAEPAAPPQKAWLVALAWCVRALARIWVVSLVLLTAAFAGIGVYKAFEIRAELTELRKAPGPQAYAVVAYRRELARQIRAYGRNWNESDAVPQPPPRSRLMAEIDAARQRNADLRRVTSTVPPLVAPP